MKGKPEPENPYSKISATVRELGRVPGNAPASPTGDTPPALPATRPVGRPKGKRSNPGFVQATAYVDADTHHKVKLALLKERKGREFSELVGDLLFEWLERQPAE